MNCIFTQENPIFLQVARQAQGSCEESCLPCEHPFPMAAEDQNNYGKWRQMRNKAKPTVFFQSRGTTVPVNCFGQIYSCLFWLVFSAGAGRDEIVLFLQGTLQNSNLWLALPALFLHPYSLNHQPAPPLLKVVGLSKIVPLPKEAACGASRETEKQKGTKQKMQCQPQ